MMPEELQNLSEQGRRTEEQLREMFGLSAFDNDISLEEIPDKTREGIYFKRTLRWIHVEETQEYDPRVRDFRVVMKRTHVVRDLGHFPESFFAQ